MKKKGLIIATIVMVLVLAVSLTTATYAWFTTSSVTKIEGFGVSVASTNDVNIGFRNAAGLLTSNITTAGFVSGDTEYISGTAGVLGGYWGGSSAINGLSNTLNHDFAWGAQTRAVAAEHSGSAITNPSASISSYDEIGDILKENAKDTIPDGYAYYSINAGNMGETSGTLDSETLGKAVANKNGTGNGDYVYMVLGVQPTKTLDVNTLVIMLDLSESTLSTVGIVGSIHVAYRITKANIGTNSSDTATYGKPLGTATTGVWNEVDIMGDNDYSTQKASVSTNVENGDVGEAAYADAYKSTYGVNAVPTASYATFITGLSTVANAIDQIELVIYMDGHDDDCINAGLGASCNVNIFFCTKTVSA